MHKQLEEYLAEVANDFRRLPPSRRNEELREMQSHLLSAVEAYEELGETEEEAIASTLRQFGPPQYVSADLVAVWQREQGTWRDTVKANLLGAASLWCVYPACMALGNYVTERSSTLTAWLSPHFEPLFYGLLLGMSALAGVLLRQRIARCGVIGLLWGTGLGYVVPWAVYEIFHAWTDSDIGGVSFIVSLQAACLVGVASAGKRRQACLPRTRVGIAKG